MAGFASAHLPSEIFLLPLGMGASLLTEANIVESKSDKNPWISALAKVVQIAPYALLFAFGCSFVGGITFFCIPITLQYLKAMAHSDGCFPCEKTLQFLDISFMTIAKVTTIALIGFGIAASFTVNSSLLCPIILVSYICFFISNISATVKELLPESCKDRCKLFLEEKFSKKLLNCAAIIEKIVNYAPLTTMFLTLAVYGLPLISESKALPEFLSFLVCPLVGLCLHLLATLRECIGSKKNQSMGHHTTTSLLLQ